MAGEGVAVGRLHPAENRRIMTNKTAGDLWSFIVFTSAFRMWRNLPDYSLYREGKKKAHGPAREPKEIQI
jgi:hypothetical protein